MHTLKIALAINSLMVCFSSCFRLPFTFKWFSSVDFQIVFFLAVFLHFRGFLSLLPHNQAFLQFLLISCFFRKKNLCLQKQKKKKSERKDKRKKKETYVELMQKQLKYLTNQVSTRT